MTRGLGWLGLLSMLVVAGCGSDSKSNSGALDGAGAGAGSGGSDGAGAAGGSGGSGANGGSGAGWGSGGTGGSGSWTTPALAGQFILGPDDYESHVEKTGAAPEVVHLFVDWISSESIAASNADPTTPIEPVPVEEIGLPIFDFAFEPGTTVALSWAMPLPAYDVPASAYPNIPSLRHLLNGRYDDYVREFARALAALESPVLFTLFGEFDNNAFYGFGPEGLHAAAPDEDLPPELTVPVATDLTGHYGDPEVPDGPERVRDAFVRVIEIFREEGATQVRWFMYGSSGFASRVKDGDQTQLTPILAELGMPEHYYPGDEYIDFVGKSLHHDGMTELQDKFELAYERWGAVTQRPFFSPEFTIYEGVGSKSRAPAIREEFMTYFPSFARFGGLAMVDQDPVTGDTEFGLVTLGGENGEFPDEIEAWREAVVENPNWKTR